MITENILKTDIKELNDVKQIVDDFYGKIREDELLADIFNSVIQDRWPQHLEKMYSFWATVLLDVNTYYGAPFMPHRFLPVRSFHFERWLSLFDETVDNYFQGENAEKAKRQGHKMAQIFQYKMGIE
ncbi:MAG: group III truncated hemoglobin [Chitinophagales bacterium]|nr:group III truncated hemoglobin [Chitinophagales bacterium]